MLGKMWRTDELILIGNQLGCFYWNSNLTKHFHKLLEFRCQIFIENVRISSLSQPLNAEKTQN